MMTEFVNYAESLFLQETPACAELRAFAKKHEYQFKLTHPLQTQFLCFLARSLQAVRVLELGTFLGYTTLALAEALPEQAQVVTCERNEQWLNQARSFWEAAGMAEKIATYSGDAKEAMQCMLEEGQGHSFDLIYVDAEKRDYPDYLKLGLELLQPRGVLAFDNVLKVHHGDVVAKNSPTTRALHAFNCAVGENVQLETSLLPMFDGLLLVRQK